MKFSIIIATHNAAKGLPKTLDSILSQIYKDYEVVVVDGASTDGTQGLIENYEKKFNGKLRWISEPDKGIYDAMNKGISIAKGEWLYFLGSGDVFYDIKVLSSVSDALKKESLNVIYGNIQWGDSNVIYGGKFSKFKLIRKNICHQAIFFNKKVFERLGKYDTKYKTGADYVFNIIWFNDKGIESKYIKKTIAIYDVGGYSAKNYDSEFWPERKTMIKRYFPAHIIILSWVYTLFCRLFTVFGFLSRGDIGGLKNKIKERHNGKS